MRTTSESPKLDRSENLVGPDKDRDGIRDDIDRYLSAVHGSEREKAALFQAA